MKVTEIVHILRPFALAFQIYCKSLWGSKKLLKGIALIILAVAPKTFNQLFNITNKDVFQFLKIRKICAKIMNLQRCCDSKIYKQVVRGNSI